MPRDGEIIFGDLIGKLPRMQQVWPQWPLSTTTPHQGAWPGFKVIDWLDEITAVTARRKPPTA